MPFTDQKRTAEEEHHSLGDTYKIFHIATIVNFDINYKLHDGKTRGGYTPDIGSRGGIVF